MEKDERTSCRKIHQNGPPRSREITMNTQVICVIIFSNLFSNLIVNLNGGDNHAKKDLNKKPVTLNEPNSVLDPFS